MKQPATEADRSILVVDFKLSTLSVFIQRKCDFRSIVGLKRISLKRYNIIELYIGIITHLSRVSIYIHDRVIPTPPFLIFFYNQPMKVLSTPAKVGINFQICRGTLPYLGSRSYGRRYFVLCAILKDACGSYTQVQLYVASIRVVQKRWCRRIYIYIAGRKPSRYLHIANETRLCNHVDNTVAANDYPLNHRSRYPHPKALRMSERRLQLGDANRARISFQVTSSSGRTSGSEFSALTLNAPMV